MNAAMNQEQVDTTQESWTYEDLCSRTFQLILPYETYRRDEAAGAYTDLSATDAGMDYLYGADEVGTTLKIVGIARVNEDAVASMMTASIGYTSALTTHVIETTANSDIVKAQLADPATDVLSGLHSRPGTRPPRRWTKWNPALQT